MPAPLVAPWILVHAATIMAPRMPLPPTPTPPYAAAALGAYLGHGARALRGLLVPSAAPPLGDLPGRAAQVALRSRGLRWTRRVLGALAALFGLLCLWVLAGGGTHVALGPLEVSVHSLRNPSKLLFASLAGWLMLTDLCAGSWHGVRYLQRVGELAPGARLGLVLWLVVSWSTLGTVERVRECLRVQSERAATGQGSHLLSNEWHLHLRPLIEYLALHPDGQNLALVIDDINPRGHLDSYYAYPRLLRMQLELHAWSLREMMTRGGELDPGFAGPGPEPDLESSRRWARERGLELLIASPSGVTPSVEPGR